MTVLAILVTTLGTIVPSLDPTIAIGSVVGLLLLFIGSFASTRFALFVLIFATLLSPEFGSRSTSGGGLTIRVDDFLLLLIAFSQLARAAVNRDIGIFVWTPLNRYITYYMLVCVVSTGAGMMAGRVTPLTGFFFVLKYFEYYIAYFLMVNNIENRTQARQFLIAIFLTAAIVSVIAVAQIPTGGRVVAPFEGDEGEPNTLGGYLLRITSIAGGLFLIKDAVSGFSHKLALLSLLGLMAVPILFTLSRATWLAAIPVVALLWIFASRKGF